MNSCRLKIVRLLIKRYKIIQWVSVNRHLRNNLGYKKYKLFEVITSHLVFKVLTYTEVIIKD